jgi:hypothetical protein
LRAIRRLLPATLAVLALGLSPACGQARYSPKKAIWEPAYLNGVSQFPRYSDLGIGIFQAPVYWNDVAPTRPAHPRDPGDPAYLWPEAVTRAVGEARQYGIRVALMLIGAPKWTNGGRPWGWSPRNARDYADFAYAASRRYPSVRLWMIWGEPSRGPNWLPLTPAQPGRRLSSAQAAAPRRYARLLDAAYGSLKQAGHANQVIGGMTYTTGDISSWQWIANMRLPNGRPPRLDLYGHNPFSFRHPDLRNPPSCCDQVDFSDLGRFASAVDRNLSRGRRRHIPFFLSEFTLPTDVDRDFNFHVDPQTQANWIRDILKVVRRSARIRAFGWVNFQDDPPSPDGSPVRTTGLLDYQGNPKPGYFAFKSG